MEELEGYRGREEGRDRGAGARARQRWEGVEDIDSGGKERSERFMGGVGRRKDELKKASRRRRGGGRGGRGASPTSGGVALSDRRALYMLGGKPADCRIAGAKSTPFTGPRSGEAGGKRRELPGAISSLSEGRPQRPQQNRCIGESEDEAPRQGSGGDACEREGSPCE